MYDILDADMSSHSIARLCHPPAQAVQSQPMACAITRSGLMKLIISKKMLIER